MKKLFISGFVAAFLGCTSGAPRPEFSQSTTPLTSVAEVLNKPTLKQVMPTLKHKAPSSDLLKKRPALKLQPRQLTMARPAPSAI